MAILSYLKAVLTVDTKGWSQGLKKSQKEAESFGNSISKIGGTIGAAFSTVAIIKFTEEMTVLNRHLYNSNLAFERFGGNTAYLEKLRKATGYMVTDLKLMQQTVQATNLGLRQSDLPTFFEFATIRAAETGVAVDYLLNSIVTGIGRESRLVLDNLGISLLALNREIAKTGNFATGAISLMNKEIASTNRNVRDASIGFSQLVAQVENLQQAIAKTAAIQAFDDLFYIISKTLPIITNNISAYSTFVSETIRFISSFYSVPRGLIMFFDAIENVTKILKLGEASEEFAKLKEELQEIALMSMYGVAPYNPNIYPKSGSHPDPDDSYWSDLMGDDIFTSDYVKHFQSKADKLVMWLEEWKLNFIEVFNFSDEEFIDDIPFDTAQIVAELEAAQAAAEAFGRTLSEVASIGIMSLAGAISELVSGGDPLNVLKNFLTDLGNMLMMYGASLIALGVGEELATKGGPYGAIVGGAIILAAGAALAAVGGAMNETISAGGYSGGSSGSGSYSGGTYGGGGSYDYNREVVMVARGDDLVATINRNNFRDGYYG